MKPRALFLGVLSGLATLAVPAAAWQVEAPFRATVNDHQFDNLKLTSSGCTVDGVLFFAAPESGYQGKNEVRNTHRFRAMVKLSDGARIVTRVFRNREPGRRKYLFSHDTTSEGCWAEKPHKVVRVEVNGCRNKGCAVPGFE